jgi:hypothetical protein
MPQLAGGDGKEGGMKRLPFFLSLFGWAFLATACGQPGGAPGPTDLEPVGEGLKVIGFAVVAASVVLSVGRLFRQP